jgi:aminoglycoside phosphotransferase (APT) family kinase protein
VRLHDNEFTIEPELVQHLLATQMPDLASRSLERFESSGTVNEVFRLGADLAVRLPKTPDFAGGPQREARWMPVMAKSLPIHVPTYERLGTPTAEYPSHWSVLEWIEGVTASESTIGNLDQVATELGEFVVALRGVATDGAPKGGSYRAFGLSKVEAGFRKWVAELPDDIDQSHVIKTWQMCTSVGPWGGKPSWLHADLRGDNMIAKDGLLVAVIDWEGCTVGDPSADHLAGWWLFDSESRESFRTASRADKETWFRAMGWALYMSVAAIPYYTETNPAFASQARHALNAVLEDRAEHG